MNIQTQVGDDTINIVSINGNGTDLYMSYVKDGQLRTKKYKELTHTGEIIIGINSEVKG
jgi:uncharacterized protein YxeA